MHNQTKNLHNLIIRTDTRDFQMETYPRRIPIALCCDHNAPRMAAVTILSLAMGADRQCNYDIYCITTRQMSANAREQIRAQVAGTRHRIAFKTTHTRTNIYAQLAKLFPEIDKIIYCDTNMIFTDNLVALSRILMGDAIVAGVPMPGGGGINTGLLVFNLKHIRDTGMRPAKLKTIIESATPAGVITLPLRYNIPVYARDTRQYAARDICDLPYRAVALNFSGPCAPWLNSDPEPNTSYIWWRVARATHLWSDARK